MSLSVALQSVVYYVFACSACRKVSHRRRRRAEAARDKKRTANLFNGLDEDIYYQPEPSTMNIHWQEDIALGPIPSKQRERANSKKASSKLSSRGSSTGVTSSALKMGDYRADTSNTASQTSSTETSTSTVPSSSTTLAAAEADGVLTTDKTSAGGSAAQSPSAMNNPPDPDPDPNWNRRRYQRQDEALWGHQIYNDSIAEEDENPESSRAAAALTRMLNIANRIKDNATNLAATYTTSATAATATIPTEPPTKLGEGNKPTAANELPSRTISAASSLTRTKRSRTNTYATSRNPPVNEYHPPVVSTPPLNVIETRWMLQPPPSAKVMAGKERVESSHSNVSRLSVLSAGEGSRSRSNSGASSRKSVYRRPHTRRSNLSYTKTRAEHTDGIANLGEPGDEYEADVDEEDDSSGRRRSRQGRRSSRGRASPLTPSPRTPSFAMDGAAHDKENLVPPGDHEVEAPTEDIGRSGLNGQQLPIVSSASSAIPHVEISEVRDS